MHRVVSAAVCRKRLALLASGDMDMAFSILSSSYGVMALCAPSWKHVSNSHGEQRSTSSDTVEASTGAAPSSNDAFQSRTTN